MKKILTNLILGSLLGFLILFLSCTKLEQLLTFTISDQSSITIEASNSLNLPIDIVTPDVTTNSSQAFANNNTNVNLVKNIYLDSLQLTITSPSNQTFNFLKSITIYISTDSSNEIELAYLNNIPSNVNSIALIPTSAVLDQYVKSPSYNLRTEIVTSQLLTQNVIMNVNSKFKVTANL